MIWLELTKEMYGNIKISENGTGIHKAQGTRLVKLEKQMAYLANHLGLKEGFEDEQS